MALLVKHGHLLDPSTNRDGIFDLLVENGSITKVERLIEAEVEQVIDATGKYILPGFVDLHVHLREPGFEYKETIETGSKAAAAGGFTSICPMPNTNPVIDSKDSVQFLLNKAKETSLVTIVPIGSVTKGEKGLELSDIAGMARAGAKGISEDGKSVMDANLYLQGMSQAKEQNLVVFAHCEDQSLVQTGVMNAGKKAEELGLRGIINAVEDVIVARDILLAKETGVSLHLCHCSTKDSVALIKFGKELGVHVTAEVCPHHFAMTEDEILEDNANYKMNPPLRTKEDVKALKEGLRDGIIDAIATDHAPHGEKEKKESMSSAPFGIVGLETAFPLAVTTLVEEGYLTKLQLAEKMSYNPARIIGIDGGTLKEGSTADFVIVDFDIEYEIDRNTFYSKGKNSPFHGKKVKGRVERTFVSGKEVYSYDQR